MVVVTLSGNILVTKYLLLLVSYIVNNGIPFGIMRQKVNLNLNSITNYTMKRDPYFKYN